MELPIIASELLKLIFTTVLVSIITLFGLGYYLKKQGPEFAKELLKTEKMRSMQQKGAESRVNKTASSMVAKDLMETTPLSELVKYLSEETREYLQEHPETLPGILQSYAGTIDLALKVAPQVQSILGLNKLEVKEKFDF